MVEVSIEELRVRSDELVDLAGTGGPVTITRGGTAVAELYAVPRPAISAEELLSRWQQLPAVDHARLRADIDAVGDGSH